jgi:Tol biopolymer transport system component
MNATTRKVLLVAAATVLSATGCAAERIDPKDSDQQSPSFNGDDVVWEDSRNEEPDGSDVYRFNYSTGIETKVAGGPGDQDQPSTSDQYIVWIDQGRLMAQSLAGGAAFNVTNGPATQSAPTICGSLVVWTDTGNNSDLYAKQLPSGSVIPVATSDAVEGYPACDQGRLAYMYSPLSGNADIRLYDVGTRQTSVVANQNLNEWRPSISGNRVVWQVFPTVPDTGIDIHGTNLETGEDFIVSAASGNQTAPVISGSTVAWEDARKTPTQIWWRDLATTMPQIPVDSALPETQSMPSLVGRQVVFQSNAPGLWNTYLAQLFYFTR